MASLPTELVGVSGRRYLYAELLQERPLLGYVWTARSGQDKFVLKDIPKNILANFQQRILPCLRTGASPLLRLPVDSFPDRNTLVYQFLTEDFLQLVRQNISMRNRRRILKDCAQAIADLHDRDVVHLDIKPDNIMVDCQSQSQSHDVTIDRVQLTDLENAAHLPRGKCVKGMLAGNDNWRSPEAHFKGELSKPSDIFSFGLVCLYAVTSKVICGPDEDFDKHESQGALPAMIRMQRQVSYFGDADALNGLMRHVGDEEINLQVLSLLWEERNEDYIPYKPFSTWPEADDEAFRDLILGMLSLDPTRRLTAEQVVKHPWFGSDVDRKN